ncbi:ABC transporter permease [Vallicoccus soli]|uniref:Transport permease protein n=1 Tax=Vallicoccus soli TaxID=2339232 RepID=A0A3A3YWT2_9ACTN|nr:ABC transporter permease [Vallicoccus soli]RJK96068.1 ABC transporter permease [Vallicoccus soli]
MTTLATPLPAATAAAHPGSFARDTWLVLVRELRPVLRDPFSLVVSMAQPLVFLALFAPLLGDVPGLGDGPALQWFVPGTIAMTCLFGASMTGSNLLLEMQTGSHERLLVAPLRRSALLVGRALKEVVPAVAQGVIVLAVVTPTSFDLHVTGAVVALLLLAAFSVGVGALSYALALASREQDWMFWAVQQTLVFPVLLLAGMLLPVDDGPAWLRAASSLDPLTYVVEAARDLLSGELATAAVGYGWLAALLVVAVGLAVGTRAVRRAG